MSKRKPANDLYPTAPGTLVAELRVAAEKHRTDLVPNETSRVRGVLREEASRGRQAADVAVTAAIAAEVAASLRADGFVTAVRLYDGDGLAWLVVVW